MPEQPPLVFCSYAPADETLCHELEKALATLQKEGLLTIWKRSMISPGANKAETIQDRLKAAEIILLLLSPDYFASDECHAELEQALKRERGSVIPIDIRHTDQHYQPLRHLQRLPRSGIPVIDRKDQAFHEIMTELRQILEPLQKREAARLEEKRPQDALLILPDLLEQSDALANPQESIDVYDEASDKLLILGSASQKANQRTSRQQLNVWVIDHHGFIESHLRRFVGREEDLARIHALIKQKMATGGYITITGPAGQGKSSLIAKLINDAGRDAIAHHFIPVNPSPGHQVELLCTLLARLILKHHLSEIYLADRQLPTLRSALKHVIGEIAAKGTPEVIYLDGLDQIKSELDGKRDLSFLPEYVPPGIVFVLGTRPNDTLQPLQVLKCLDEYELSHLKRTDFDLLLKQGATLLLPSLVDRLYEATGGNALYLDLVVEELQKQRTIDPEMVLQRIKQAPYYLFSFALERLKEPWNEWREVIKPILGILLIAKEPLGVRQMHQILGIEEDLLQNGLQRLGGLLTRDKMPLRYSLYHRELQDYLREDSQDPDKVPTFPVYEERRLHEKITQWCEQDDLSTIWVNVNDRWEQRRRDYARRYYVVHLYEAQLWQKVFQVLNEGSYGHKKVAYDASRRLYIQDLDAGRQAAMREELIFDEKVSLLPHYWYYTLLRCSLSGQADHYPLETFQLLLSLGREATVTGLLELLAEPTTKVQVALLLANALKDHPERKAEQTQWVLRALAFATPLFGPAAGLRHKSIETLSAVMRALIEEEQWERAREMVHAMKCKDRSWPTRILASVLIKRECWEQVQEITRFIDWDDSRGETLCDLVEALVNKEQWEQAVEVVHSIEDGYAKTRALSTLATALVRSNHQGRAEEFWLEAEVVARSAQGRGNLADLVLALVEVQHYDRAERLWKEAEETAQTSKNGYGIAINLSDLAHTLMRAKQWERAERIVRSIESKIWKATSLTGLAAACMREKHYEQAMRLWREVKDIHPLDSHFLAQVGNLSVHDLVISLAKEYHWESAQEVIDAFSDEYWRTKLSNELIEEVLAKEERWDHAEAIAHAVKGSYYQAQTLRKLAGIFSEHNQQERAARLWDEAEEMARSLENLFAKVEVFGMLARDLAQVHQPQRAWRLWSEAEEMARSLEDSVLKIKAVSTLAQALEQTHQKQQAERLWKRAIDGARSLENRGHQAQALTVLAKALAEVQLSQQAEKLWVELEALVPSLLDYDERNSFSEEAEGLRTLADALIDVQEWDRAEKVTCSVSRVDPKGRINMIVKLATALLRTQQQGRAEKLWRETEEFARSIEDIDDRVSSLCSLVPVLIEAQQQEHVKKLWTEAEELAYSIEYDYALVAVVDALIAGEQWEHAEKVANDIRGDGYKDNYLKNCMLRRLALAKILTQVKQRPSDEGLWAEIEGVLHTLHTVSESEKASLLHKSALIFIEKKQWNHAEKIVSSLFTIPSPYQRFWNHTSLLKYEVAKRMIEGLLASRHQEKALHLLHVFWQKQEDRDNALLHFCLVQPFIVLKPELGIAFAETFERVDQFLNGNGSLLLS